jgi:hypothetical protein
VKLHLNNVKENEIDIEKEWKNLQIEQQEGLGTTKRRNKRKYLKILDDQTKQLTQTKKKII